MRLRRSDPAIIAVRSSASYLYDDLTEHYLIGEFALQVSERRDFLRWIMFLYSDFDYRWPPIGAPGRKLLYNLN